MISFVTLILAMSICTYKGKIASAFSMSKSIFLDIAVINQLPEYYNGCEATSLTMMLNHAGIKVEKTTVVSMVKKDVTPIKYD